MIKAKPPEGTFFVSEVVQSKETQGRTHLQSVDSGE